LHNNPFEETSLLSSIDKNLTNQAIANQKTRDIRDSRSPDPAPRSGANVSGTECYLQQNFSLFFLNPTHWCKIVASVAMR
jgi:hypothetical protein